MRVVVDTNVLVAARLTENGVPGQVIKRWLVGQIEIVVSSLLLHELDDVLGRSKFRRWLSQAEADAFIELLGDYAVFVDDPEPEPGLTRDPDDDYLVVLARAAGAVVLVSGDKDLVDLRDAKPIVRTPRQLIEVLDRREAG